MDSIVPFLGVSEIRDPSIVPSILGSYKDPRKRYP